MLCEKLEENIEFKIPQIQGAYFSLYNIALDLTSNQAILFLVKDARRILIIQLSRNIGGIRSTNLCIDFANQKNVVLLTIKGSVHIIGGYKKQLGGDFKQTQKTKAHALATQQKDERMKYGHNIKQKMPQQPTKQIEQVPTQNQSLRRSTRARAPPKPTPFIDTKAAKREKEEIKNMAKYFECNLDQDEDDSFSEQNQDEDQSQSQDDQEMDEQQLCAPSNKSRKIKNKPSKPKQNAPDQQKSQKIQEQSTDKSLHYSVPTRNPYQ